MKAKTLYPHHTEGYGPCDYQPILEDIGSILLQVDDQDYQGDSRVLFEKDGKFGILIFGWGSCSGCDALQACDTWEALEDEIQSIQNSVKWFDSANECLAYFENHDWKGDYSYHQDETKKFIEQGKETLKHYLK